MSKFLTILLTILIIIFIVFIGIWVYSSYVQYDIETEGQRAIEEFDELISSNDILYVGIQEEQKSDEIIEENIEDNIEGNKQVEQKHEKQESTNSSKIKKTTASTTKSTSTVQKSTTTATSTPAIVQKKMYRGYVMAGYIQIPITKVKIPIVESVAPKALEKSVGILSGPGLNKPGNTVIVGHNYRNSTLFSKNYKIEIGDVIYITDETGQMLIYTVYNIYETSPEDSDYMNRQTEDNIEISLSTCTNDDSKRLIIWAKVIY